MSARVLCLAAALWLAAPLAQADEDVCQLQIGHGWPPATERYGSAVEQLFADGAQPILSLTQLPGWGKESGLLLMPAADGGNWRLRYAEADERVLDLETGGGSFSRQLRTDQVPEVAEVPMPADLASRLVAAWQQVLATTVPRERKAGFHDDDVWLFVVDGVRMSGLAPDCGPAERLMEQAEILVEATDDDAEDRVERWQELARSLDELHGEMAGGG